MARIVLEQPPVKDDALAEWLMRMLNNTNAEVERLQFIIDQLTIAGYGELRQADPVAFGPLGASWLVVPGDTVVPDEPLYTLPDPATNSIALLIASTWLVSVSILFLHNESTQERSFEVRLTNIDLGTSTEPDIVSIGRNTTTTPIDYKLLISSLDLRHKYVIEVGNGSTVSDMFVQSYSFVATNVGSAEGFEG